MSVVTIRVIRDEEKQKTNIYIEGRRGSGKTLYAELLRRILAQSGVKPVEVSDGPDTRQNHMFLQTLRQSSIQIKDTVKIIVRDAEK
jgi:adenylylsulfate kinase-like enzyme